MGNYQAGTPDDWWAGYDTDLGEALGARYDLRQRRHPARLHARHRAARTRPTPRRRPCPWAPATATSTVSSGPRDAGPGHRRRAPAHVRRRSAGAGHRRSRRRRPRRRSTRRPRRTSRRRPPPRRRRPPSRLRSSAPRPRRSPARPAAAATSASISRVSGKRVKISGRVAGATSGKVKLVIQRKTRGKWKTVRTVAAPLKQGRLVREDAHRRGGQPPRPGALRRHQDREGLALLLPHLLRAPSCKEGLSLFRIRGRGPHSDRLRATRRRRGRARASISSAGCPRTGTRPVLFAPAEFKYAAELPMRVLPFRRDYSHPHEDARSLGRLDARARRLRPRPLALGQVRRDRAGRGRARAAAERVHAARVPVRGRDVGGAAHVRRRRWNGRWIRSPTRSICVCEFERDLARENGLKARLEVVHNGCPPAPEVESAHRARWPGGRRGRTLRRAKRIDVLLDAMPLVLREVPEARLVVAGEGPLRDELHQQAARPGPRRRVA